MADIQLSDQDIDYIARVVATEVPGGVRRNPMEYNRMVGAVVDTVTNRLASGRYGKTVPEVLNQNRAFSKITGPKRLAPYGSVENTPRAPKYVQNAVNEHLASRRAGIAPEIKGATDYANPNYSDASNLRRWVNPMISAGATKVGMGKSVHYHGNAPGSSPAPSYGIQTPADFMRPIENDVRHIAGVPIPTPRQPMAQMAEARAFDRGGIISAPKVSLNPVSSANAGERPQVKVIRAPVQQAGYTPADQASRQAPAKTSTGISFSRVQGPQTLYNRSGGSANDFRPMPSGPIAQPQAPMRDRPMPSGLMTQAAPVASPASMTAAYQQYGQTRQAAPQGPMNTQSATSPNINVQASAGTMATPIQGPLDGQAIQTPGAFPAAPAAPTLKQRAMGTLRNVMTPDNLKKAGLTAVGGALGGPVGAAIGGMLGNAMNSPQQGGILSGLLSSLGGNGNQSMQSTYIGNGVNAVQNAMYGNRRGDTATYNSQGGGSVTNLGNGESQRTSNKYGWTETTHRDGSKSISYKK